jgi:type I restriction enzyme, S subunit
MSGVLKASRSYPQVKPSGFDWLGDIPSHWAVHRLSNVCGFASGKAHEQFVQSNGTHVCVNARFVSTDGRTRKYATKNLSPAQRGDVLMVMSDLPNGRALARAFYVENDVSYAVNQRVCALSARHDLSPKFLFYFANRNHFLLRNDDGCNQTHLPNSAFKTMPTLLPPFEEQEAIVRFLDWANGRLERVIRGKRKVIALLTEQKQAIIHRAVTRGLDPTVPLKPSGIPWLGDIPAHWEVWPLRRCISIRSGDFADSGKLAAEQSETHAIPVIGGNGVMAYTNRSNDSGPTIVIGRVGALCGNVHLVTSPSWITDNALRISRVSGFQHRYLAEQLRVMDLNRLSNANAQPLVTGGVIKSQRVARPPASEQGAIIEGISALVTPVDEAISRLKRDLLFLAEYRTRLTADVVTGKLDVREAAKNLPVEPESDFADEPANNDELELDEDEAVV